MSILLVSTPLASAEIDNYSISNNKNSFDNVSMEANHIHVNLI